MATSINSVSSHFPVNEQAQRLQHKASQHELRRRRIRLQGRSGIQGGRVFPTSAFNPRAGDLPSCSSYTWTCLTDEEWADKEDQVQLTGRHLAEAAEVFRWTPYLLNERDRFETTTFLSNTRNRTAFTLHEEDEPWLPCSTSDPTSDLLFYEGHCNDLDTYEPAREFAARFASLLTVQKERRRRWNEYWSRASSVSGQQASELAADASPVHVGTEGKADSRSLVAKTRPTVLPGTPIRFGIGTTMKVPSITLSDCLDDRMSIVFGNERPEAWSVVTTWQTPTQISI